MWCAWHYWITLYEEHGRKICRLIFLSATHRLQDSYELDFASDPTDIRCPEAHEADMTSVYHRPIQQYTSEYKCSLRVRFCNVILICNESGISFWNVYYKNLINRITKLLLKIIIRRTCNKIEMKISENNMNLYKGKK